MQRSLSLAEERLHEKCCFAILKAYHQDCIVTLFLKSKKGAQYELPVEPGEDILYALDNFLKRSKLDLRSLTAISASCDNEESMACRAASIVVQSLKFKLRSKSE